MAQLLVRNLDDDVKAKLRVRAAEHGRSMEEEVRAILRQAVEDRQQPPRGLGTEIACDRSCLTERSSWIQTLSLN